MKIRDIAVDRLTPYPGNPRINDRAISRVAKLLSQFGWNQPIVVDKDFVVVAGHTRLEAAKSLGLDKVPVFVAEHLTPEDAKAYRIADNKSAEWATWNDTKLFDELKAISEFASVEVTGFTQSEMLALEMQAKELLEASAPTASKQPEPVHSSLTGSEPSPATPNQPEPDAGSVGLEDENDHDGTDEEVPQAPAMVSLNLVVDEEQRRAIVSALNEAKTKSGCETLGAALHIVCLEWMESRR